MDTNLQKYFEKYNINFVKYEHRAVFTVDESRDLKKSIPGLHCKCLFLKDQKIDADARFLDDRHADIKKHDRHDSGKFYLVGMPANKRLDVKKLQMHFKAGKLHFASEEELFKKLKLKPGSVSIFGMINNTDRDVTLIIDKIVWNSDYVGFHPNINTATLVLEHDDLERFYNSVKNDKEVIEL